MAAQDYIDLTLKYLGTIPPGRRVRALQMKAKTDRMVSWVTQACHYSGSTYTSCVDPEDGTTTFFISGSVETFRECLEILRGMIRYAPKE